jgi:hypothetical protein
MRILDDIPFEIDPRTVFASLHLEPDGQYAIEVNGLIDAARRLARPRALYKTAVVRRREPDAVVIAETASSLEPSRRRHADCGQSPPLPHCCSVADGGATAEQARFVSRALRVNLDEVDRVFPYVATCGVELDSIPIASDDVFGQFCRDAIKEMALWAALSHLYVHLTETFGSGALASMNPGSGEAKVWPIEQQRELFAFLGDVRESIGVVLTGSCLMVPNKSVSGIFYPSRDGFESCQLCRQERCSHRRAPFDPELWARTFGEAQ